MGWNGPILTDSGGFQLLSLRALARIEERGATLESPVDGTPRCLTPEVAMEVQADLGSDIAMVLDVCSPYPCDPADLVAATDRTARWAARSLRSRHAAAQSVFGIVQGGTNLELRRRSARAIAALGFDGYAIGGLSVGEERRETWPALDAAIDELPPQAPRYLMGVGAPRDLLEGIGRGVDLFDSVFPTRLGRRGSVFVREGRRDLLSSQESQQREPIDPTCDCAACASFSVGYLHHLLRAREELGMRLASLHNVGFLTRLAASARDAIVEGCFSDFLRTHLPGGLLSESLTGSSP
jgi:queuine tRNA-ribosyltransferase